MSLDQKIREALRSSVRPADPTAGYQAVQARLQPAPREGRSGLRIALYASLAVVIVAAIAVGSLEAVKHLGGGEPILYITDDEAVEQQLATITAERDALLAEKQAAAVRYEKSKATQEQIQAIIADPTAFGTDTEVVAMLRKLAVPGLFGVNTVFGSYPWAESMRLTLFNNRNAHIRTWRSWLSEDGSTGGSLWTWSGSALNGAHFDLEGAELSRFDENGLLAEVVMFFAYEDEEVLRRFNEGN